MKRSIAIMLCVLLFALCSCTGKNEVIADDTTAAIIETEADTTAVAETTEIIETAVDTIVDTTAEVSETEAATSAE